MRMRFLAPFLLLPVLAQAQMYRWVDEGGKVHYSDQAPAPGARNVQKKSMPVGQGSSAGLPYALQQAVRDFPVTLYTADLCKETCSQARELLSKRGVPYRETTVADEADLAQLKQLSGETSVPVMTVGREVYRGFEAATYNAALDRANYPASSLLPPGVQARQPVAKQGQKASPPSTETGGEPAASEGKGAANKEAAKAGPKTLADQEQAFRKRQLDAAKVQEEEAKKQAEAREKAENCNRAKQAVLNLQIGGRQMRIDENGERVFLNEQQIAQEMARAQQITAATCN